MSSASDYEAALAAAWAPLTRVSQGLQWWQRNSWLATVMEPSSFLRQPAATVIVPPPMPAVASAASALGSRANVMLSGSGMVRAKAKVTALTWPVSQKAARSRAVEKWRLIILHDIMESRVGEQIMLDLASGAGVAKASEVIRDVMEPKATKTLQKRGGTLLKYMAWAEKTKAVPFPYREQQAYEYVLHLRANAAPTAAKTWLEAVAFSMGMLGMAGASEVLASKRIQGASFAAQVMKRPLQQARALTALECEALEGFAESAPVVADRVVAGYLCFMLYGRCRFSDALEATAMTDDGWGTGGFLQVDTARTKTGRSAAKRVCLLPLVAPKQGLRQGSWADSFLEARRMSGLEDDVFPILPALSLAGVWLQEPMSSSELSAALREMLRVSGSSEESLVDVSSHSLKATTLSWLSKYGVKRSTRKMLGYHTISKDATMESYSRDLLSAPLRVLEEVIGEVRNGNFCPDETRSGMLRRDLQIKRRAAAAWVQESEPGTPLGMQRSDANPATPVDDRSGPFTPASPRSSKEPLLADSSRAGALESDDGSSGSSGTSAPSDSSSECEDDEVEACAEVVSRSSPAPPAPDMGLVQGDLLYQHRRSKTLHRSTDSLKFGCGRLVSEVYAPVPEEQSFWWPRCAVCFP